MDKCGYEKEATSELEDSFINLYKEQDHSLDRVGETRHHETRLDEIFDEEEFSL